MRRSLSGVEGALHPRLLMKTELKVREETVTDVAAIRRVNELAFGGTDEADIVEALRRQGAVILSLVALQQSRIVGHILFSPVTIDCHGFRGGVASLGPMAVLPKFQRQGIGSKMVREGLGRCRDLGCRAVILLGHPEYYPRFGFRPAGQFGLRSEFEAPPEAFMALELIPGSLQGLEGLVSWHAAFHTPLEL